MTNYFTKNEEEKNLTMTLITRMPMSLLCDVLLKSYRSSKRTNNEESRIIKRKQHLHVRKIIMSEIDLSKNLIYIYLVKSMISM